MRLTNLFRINWRLLEFSSLSFFLFRFSWYIAEEGKEISLAWQSYKDEGCSSILLFINCFTLIIYLAFYQIAFVGYLQGPFHKDFDFFCIMNADLYFNLLSYWIAHRPINMTVLFEFLMKGCFPCSYEGLAFCPRHKEMPPKNIQRETSVVHVAGFVFVLS